MRPDSNSEPIEGGAEASIDPTLLRSKGLPTAGDLEALKDAPDVPDVNMTGVLGRGGQGVVYRGHQEFLERDVAVKVLHKSVERDHTRFRREATLLAKIQHPNVVACYQAGVTSENQCYMVLEYVEGEDLFCYVKDKGPLSEDSALALIADVARGLQHGYDTSARMIHRDVKPQNVLLQISEEGPGPRLRGKIVDLGLARCLEESMELTVVGAVMGTPSTMAPEQYDSPHEVDHRTDIYGLGCVLFFALTGDSAFKGPTITAIYRQKTSSKPARLREELGLCQGTRKLLDTMLARKQDARPATYDDLLELIRTVRASLRQAPSRKGWGVKKSVWIGAGIAAAAVVGALLSIKGGSAESDRPNLPPSKRADSSAGSRSDAQSNSGAEDATGLSPQGDAPAALANGAAGPDVVDEPRPAPRVIDIPLTDSLAAGSTMRLWPAADPFVRWWATGEGPDSVPEGDLWRLKGGHPRGGADSTFEDAQESAWTKDALEDTDSPSLLFVSGCSAISHALPEGPTGIRGRMVLSKEGPGDALVGGLVLRRRDGSMLELSLSVIYPEGSLAGKKSKRWGILRAGWFSATGEPLYPKASADFREFYAVGDEDGTMLSGNFVSKQGPTLTSRDKLAVDFEIRLSADGYKLLYGDENAGLMDELQPPADLALVEFRELITFCRSGFLTLRDVEFFGIGD